MKKTILFFIAFALAALAYFHNNIFIDFADEGYLWYGAAHILKGQVPILDFQAYEPGRYYWSAAVLYIFGNRLMALRLAAGLFQGTGLFLALLSLSRAANSRLRLVVAGFVAVLWMLIPCRYFDASMPLFAVFFATRLAEDPSMKRHFEAGLFTGLAVFFGINHGLYLLAAFSTLALYLEARHRDGLLLKKIQLFTAGFGAGLLPLILMCAAVPGFAAKYWERMGGIASAMASGKAGVAFRVAWPWTVSWPQIHASFPTMAAGLFEFTNRFSTGLLFVFVIVYYSVAVIALFRRSDEQTSQSALFTASVFIGLFYLRHVFSRADVCYLGEGIFPVWAGLIACASRARTKISRYFTRTLIVFFIAASLGAAGLISTIAFKNMVPKSGMTWYQVGSDRIWVLRSDAAYIDNVKKLVGRYVKPDEPILLAPLLTTFYCLLGKESPVYELYFHLAPTPAMERRILAQLEEKNVRWAIAADLLVDGHPEQMLSRSHPLLWEYLSTRFEKVSTQGLRPGYALMRRKV